MREGITDPGLESFTALPASQRSVTLHWPVPVLAGADGCHVHCACAAIACMAFIVAGQPAFSNIALQPAPVLAGAGGCHVTFSVRVQLACMAFIVCAPATHAGARSTCKVAKPSGHCRCMLPQAP
jgi:hypothetical protein